MNFFSKLVVVFLIVLAILYAKDKFFSGENTDIADIFSKQKDGIQLPADTEETEIPAAEEIKKEPKILVNIYFTTTTGGIKKISRELPQNKTKTAFAIEELLKGPDFKERQQGTSSEIPKGTKILSVKETENSVIIDLSDEFQYGGGTESQYTRLKQLINTIVGLKLSKPAYLYLNGQKAEVIGGEGIILTQPLSGNSLND